MKTDAVHVWGPKRAQFKRLVAKMVKQICDVREDGNLEAGNLPYRYLNFFYV